MEFVLDSVTSGHTGIAKPVGEAATNRHVFREEQGHVQEIQTSLGNTDEAKIIRLSVVGIPSKWRTHPGACRKGCWASGLSLFGSPVSR